MGNDHPISPEAAERALKDAAITARAVEMRTGKLQKRDELRKYGKPVVNAAINSPHTVQARGNQLAIHIAPPDNILGLDDATFLEDDVWFNAADSTFYYINIYTDGRFEAI